LREPHYRTAQMLHAAFIESERKILYGMTRDDTKLDTFREDVRMFFTDSRQRWETHMLNIDGPVARDFYQRFAPKKFIGPTPWEYLPSILVNELKASAKKRSQFVVETRRDRMLLALEDIKREEAEQAIADQWDREKMDYIFTNDEVAGTSNIAGLAGAKEQYEYKQWWTVGDERVRSSHAAVHGEMVPIDDVFIVGGYEMEAPHDWNAPLDEILGCRCYMGFELVEDFGR
jgi:hypothetical protein